MSESHWLFLCRPGAERECAAELGERAGAGYCRLDKGAGWLSWHGFAGVPALPVFARSGWQVQASFSDLDKNDRISQLVALLPGRERFGRVFLEYPDTNDGRGLQRFLRGFRKALEKHLRDQQILVTDSPQVLHLFFTDSLNGFIGVSDTADCPWENGVPRLRLPAAAPSRSALKLEEGWLRLMSPSEQDVLIRPGQQAVDLGAAPGGWTWQLARRGLRVTAVDHGRLDRAVLDEWPVTHVSADAFTWHPHRPVDWLVCDIVDKPARTLSLMSKWLSAGWARQALFNLKLPMARRWDTVSRLLAKLQVALPDWDIRAAQLYHDRDEVTVLALPGPGA
jgi:23S rRNA (cytidine2498-2'-O)-methyltransferase